MHYDSNQLSVLLLYCFKGTVHGLAMKLQWRQWSDIVFAGVYYDLPPAR